jgi:1-acyl-sn-glycerol-3-phosphate acyltransferase
VGLPRLTLGRRLFRSVSRALVRAYVRFWTTPKVSGMENFPKRGPAIIVINHLGDADAVVIYSVIPRPIEALAKIELYDLRFYGWFIHTYGVIWVHRGRPDRRAIRAALYGLAEGRIIGLAPEGRESLTGSLEEGTQGAAYLALKAGVPVVPIAVTGTENERIYDGLHHWRRTPVTVTVGKPFRLEQLPDSHQALETGTRRIMLALAELLPPEYRGVYAEFSASSEM